METLVHAGLSNALFAIPLAIVALAVGRFTRRPATAHALWLLVLIKLLTPPVWNIQIPRPATDADRPITVAAAREVESAPMPEEVALAASLSMALLPDYFDAAPEPVPAAGSQPAPAFIAIEESPAPAAAPENAPELPTVAVSWLTIIAWGWLTGSIGMILVTFWRLFQFRRAIRSAGCAPAEMVLATRAVARQLGLPYTPEVRMVAGRVSPLVVQTLGGPRLFVPAEFWNRLTPVQQYGLLAHELAHLRRGDHWIRWLEAVAGVVYWWNPLLWLARRHLREAEEQCCDAWVVWALPEARRDYASALVDVVEFLSLRPSLLPAFASGIGRVHDLQRRITMIMRGTTPRRLNRLALAGLLGAGMVVGTFGMTLAQERPKDPPRPERPDRPERPKTDRPRDGERREGADQAREELERARRALDEARHRLEEAERRVHELEGRRGGDRRPDERRPEGDRRPDGGPRPEGRPGFGRGEGPPIEQRLAQLERMMQELARNMEEIRREMQRGPGGRFPGGPFGPGGGPGAGAPGEPGAGPRGGRGGPGGAPEAGPRRGPGGPPMPPSPPTPPPPPKPKD
jgi:beta-lactamase regulating signal transducer with metallopeptidase domain